MANITHYEVYAQKGRNWRLQERLPSDQRDRAFDLAKKLEKKKVPVKIIRETFSVEDSRYMESVEYVNGLSNAEKKRVASGKKTEQVYTSKKSGKPLSRTAKESSGQTGDMVGALIRIIVIVLFCLVFANLFVTLLSSIIEEFLPAQYYEAILSTLYFILFLSTATPLVITKVPWHVFDSTGELAEKAAERKIYSTAETVISLYKLNDDIEPSISPVSEIPDHYKRYIIGFLAQIVDDLGKDVRLDDSYRKLGLRFIIFGGCLGISRYVNLSLGQANALLYEAFQIMDGNEVDIEAFYEAKKAYNGNKNALYLTGVGAFVIDRMLKGRAVSQNIIQKAFDRWISQELVKKTTTGNSNMQSKNVTALNKPFECAANIKTIIKKKDSFDVVGDDEMPRLNIIAENLIEKLAKDNDGNKIPSLEGISSVKFMSLGDALVFITEFYREYTEATSDISDENLIIENKCNILKFADLFQDNLQNFMDDLFEISYDEEVIIEKEVREKLEGSGYGFDFLGEKHLTKSDRAISIYKLVY